MSATKSETIYFDPALHDALLARATEENTSISEVVNEVLRESLADYEEEAEDLADLERRRAEPNISLEDFLADDEADHAIFEKRHNDPTVDFETFASEMKHRGRI